MKVFVNYTIPESASVLGEFAEVTLKTQCDLMKYKLMWALRGLEAEVVEEGGMIIINTTGNVETKQFSPELTVKIHEILAESTWLD